MKKLVLLAASSLAAGAAYAQDHDHEGHDHGSHTHGQKHVEIPARDGVFLSGFMDVIASHVDQDIDRGLRDTTLANDTEVHVNVRKTADAGFAYGAVIELEGDLSEDFREEGLNADKTFLFVESGYGRVEAGGVTDVGSRLSVNPSHLARGMGGVHGDWYAVAAFPGDPAETLLSGEPLSHTGHDAFIHFPSLPLHQMHAEAEDANKISYFSPRIEGLQAGFSFIPDTGDAGTYLGATGRGGDREFSDVVNLGLNYDRAFGEFRVSGSIVGEYGNAELSGNEDLEAYEVAAQLGWQAFTFGAAYGDWGKSLQPVAPGTKDAHYYSLGADYDAESYGVSITFLESTFDRNDLSVVSVGLDYPLAPGLVPFVEVAHAAFDAADPALEDNDANVIQTGVKLSF